MMARLVLKCLPMRNHRRVPVATALYPASRSLSSSPSSLSSTTSSTMRLPDKVLVANRGEIACRVLRTCRRLGIPSVAIYSSADGPDCLHALMADEAFLVGTGPSPTDSYLRQKDILKIAQQTGTTAIHPGYGFLSENANFAKAIAKSNNMTLVGPPSKAMTAMGTKSHAKKIMLEAGVPVTPGYFEERKDDADTPQDDEKLRFEANKIGYPVLIKAVAGGGGKGMRIVHNDADFFNALESCQRESLASFSDDFVLLEKLLIKPRHIEVQIIADSHGNCVHLYERDCSLQRRHQKIIEEAPASDLPDALRQQLGEMGTRAALAVGYVNAGTVEFLLDTQKDLAKGEFNSFYFCEMNTRLQVEHPITESITGIDLVEWQLRVAAGDELPCKRQQDMPRANGHAFEARIYAEQPSRGFLPATGTVWHHQPPTSINTGISDSGIRVDTGITVGQQVGVHYDPMISKLIVHDQNRDLALQKLVKALKNYQIAGVPNNIDFLTRCAQHSLFMQAGAIHTGFLDDPEVIKSLTERDQQLPSPLAQAVGVLAVNLFLENRLACPVNTKQVSTPWSSHQGSWRMGGSQGRAQRDLQLKIDSTGSAKSLAESDTITIKCICNADGSYDVITVSDDGNEHAQVNFHVKGTLDTEGAMEIVIDHTQRLKLVTVLREKDGIVQVCMWPQQGSPLPQSTSNSNTAWSINVVHPYLAHSNTAAIVGSIGEGVVRAPMPGKITRVNFREGDLVKTGDVVVVMEAMKMEHTLTAPHEGLLKKLTCRKGDLIVDGTIMFVVDSEEQVVNQDATGKS